MLLGRSAECAAIDRLMDDARGSAGGALVVRGEVGVGKSALLAHAAARAAGMRVLRAVASSPRPSCPSPACTSSWAPGWGAWSACPRPRRRRCAAPSA